MIPVQTWLLFLAITLASVQPRHFWKEGEPLQIESDTLTYDLKNKSALFVGSVKIEQVGIGLECDRLSVQFGKDSGIIRSFIATGNVSGKHDEWVFSAGTATYEMDSNALVLQENPVIRHGKDRFMGNTVTIRLGDDSITIEKAKSRLTMPSSASISP